MEAYVIDWLSLLIRWIHVIAGIAWIGHAFLFHSFEHGLRPPEVDGVDKDVKGEMWMVHGGGFFRLQKTRVLPDKYTGDLLWFKWEAAFTWISGFSLLILVFYWAGAGAMLVVPGQSPFGTGATMALGLGSLVVGWLIYDLVWSVIGKRSPQVATALTVLLVVAATIGFSMFMSGRAAFIHVGALLGTIMAANVWMRILPGMRTMLAALEAGKEPDLSRGALGKQRSLHNGYMHFPVIFIMISYHFSSTYGHAQNWLVLLLIMAFGAAMRQVLYDGIAGSHLAVKGILGASVAGLIILTALAGHDEGIAAPVTAVPPANVAAAPSEGSGAIHGVVLFDGKPPAKQPLTLFAGCENLARGTVYNDAIATRDGKLQSALVWLREGWEGFELPPVPETAVEVDQRACIYQPRLVGARVGQPVTFVNSDPIFHNVRAVVGDRSLFNINMPAEVERETRTFARPEIAIQVKCDVHPWMRAYVAIVPHPWFAVTGEDGAFSIAGVPPGEYVVEAWHEAYEDHPQRQKVTIVANDSRALSFTFAAEP